MSLRSFMSTSASTSCGVSGGADRQGAERTDLRFRERDDRIDEARAGHEDAAAEGVPDDDEGLRDGGPREELADLKERLRTVLATLDPLRLLEEIRIVRQHLAGLAKGEVQHVLPDRDADLDRSLRSLAIAWKDR
ncbi:MAG TPA: hypothetical protein VF516_42455 [Kofleriaceae bacterium]